MKDDNIRRMRANRVFLRVDSCDLDEFRALVERSASRNDYPLASDLTSNVPVYDGLEARRAAASPETRKELMAEWVEAMTDGPGIVVIRDAFADSRDRCSRTSVTGDHRRGAREQRGGGDHFAKPGANDRIWNALEKLCLRDPRRSPPTTATTSSR